MIILRERKVLGRHREGFQGTPKVLLLDTGDSCTDTCFVTLYSSVLRIFLMCNKKNFLVTFFDDRIL